MRRRAGTSGTASPTSTGRRYRWPAGESAGVLKRSNPLYPATHLGCFGVETRALTTTRFWNHVLAKTVGSWQFPFPRPMRLSPFLACCLTLAPSVVLAAANGPTPVKKADPPPAVPALSPSGEKAKPAEAAGGDVAPAKKPETKFFEGMGRTEAEQ